MLWEEDRRAVFGMVGGALWIQRQMQRGEPTDEEGWDAIVENLCFALWRCASSWTSHGEEDDFDKLVEEGWTLADILLAETKILMRADFRIPFHSPVDCVESLLNVKMTGAEGVCRKVLECGWGETLKTEHEEGLENDDWSDSGIDTTTLGDGIGGPDENTGGRANGDTGRKLIRPENSGDHDFQHHAEKLSAVLCPCRPPLERKLCK